MLNIINWQDLILNCKYDATVGIRIAKIAGNKHFSTFITAIDPGKSVNPHYHKHGDEHYHIISGSGQIYLKNIKTNEESTHNVEAGSSFIVNENTLHQLTNISETKLILMFSCPLAHLEGDRYLA